MVGDKGLASGDIEELVRALVAPSRASTAAANRPRCGNLGGVRQWIEGSTTSTSTSSRSIAKAPGVIARIAQRLLALATAGWHNSQLWEASMLDAPIRSLIRYDV